MNYLYPSVMVSILVISDLSEYFGMFCQMKDITVDYFWKIIGLNDTNYWTEEQGPLPCGIQLVTGQVIDVVLLIITHRILPNKKDLILPSLGEFRSSPVESLYVEAHEPPLEIRR